MKKTLQILLLSSFVALSLSACGESDDTSSSAPASYYGTGLAGALAHSKANTFKVSGEAITIYDGEPEKEDNLFYTISNTFSDGILSSVLTYRYHLEDEETVEVPFEVTYFAKEDGFTYQRGLTLQNTVVDEMVKTSSGGGILFEENFASPFKELSYTDFVSLTGGGYLLKPDARSSFARSLTQQNLYVKKVVFDVEKDRFSSIDIYTDSQSSSIGSIYSSLHLKLTLSWGEVASIPDVKPYTKTANHEKLDNAFYALYRSLGKKNFTAVTNMVNSAGAAMGLTYYTKEAVYSDSTDSSGLSHGYKKSGSSYYEFTLKQSESGENTFNFYDEDPIKESQIFPDFRSFSSALFESNDAGTVFELHSEFGAGVVSRIAPALQKDYYATYFASLTIRLDAKGVFSSMEIGYYDYYNTITGTATVTFQDIDATILPFEFVQ